MKRISNIALAMAGGSLFALIPAVAQAQTAPQSAAQPQNQTNDEEDNEAIIVTGTSAERTGFDTPLSVTALDSDDLRRVSATSQADILATVPGLKAEGGGGEVASNVQVRGLPSSGQFQFTPLEYDGMPVLSTFGLNSSAFDVYARNDLGVERLEYVAGGVSNLFGPGSVAGIINYISTTGGDETHGALQAEWAEKGRVRGDFAIKGPLAGNTSFALSGFYRYDEGPLRSGLPSEGYQLRGNLRHEFSDGAGSITLMGQYIDDRVQFFLPLPLNGTTFERLNGNDGETVYTVNTGQARNLTSILPDGSRYNSPIEDGVETRGGMIGFVLDRDLGNGFGLNAKVKWSRYDHQFNLFSDGDGIINVPETQTQFLANRGAGLPATATFTYADSGQVLPTSALLFANRVTNRNRPVSDFSAEIDLTKQVEAGSVTHNLTLGGWFARAEATDFNVTQTFLAEFNNAPRLVNLVANGVTYTRNGLLDPSAAYVNNEHSAKRVAAYLADQIEGDRWALDLGVRIERMNGGLNRERTATFTVAQGTGLESAALSTAVFGTGSYLNGKVATTEWAASIGALYRLTDDFNVYGNYSRGFFFPEIRSVAFNALGEPASYEGEIIQQAELGLKYSASGFTGSIAGFWSNLANRRSVTFVNAPGGGLAEVVTELSSRTFGFEAVGSYRIMSGLTVNANLTYSDHSVTKSPTPALIGKELERKPNWYANAGIAYDDGAFDASFFWNYQSAAFANAANTVELGAYSLFRLDAGYNLAIGGDQSVRLGFSVFNLFNSQGLAEGSPRQGNNQTAGGLYFVGRPILPRRISVTASYRF